MTAEALPRIEGHRLRLILGGNSRLEGYFPPDSSAEFLGPHDFTGCPWAPDKTGNEALLMSEPDLGHEREDTPERIAAHAAWLKDYCEKHRSKDG
jgi:hypothetical protein